MLLLVSSAPSQLRARLAASVEIAQVARAAGIACHIGSNLELGIGSAAMLLGWLGERVHTKGSLFSTEELVESATGRPLGTASFERHLRDRYLG